MTEGRRIITLRVPLRTATRMFTTGAMTHCIDGLPHGATCIGVYVDPEIDAIILKFEHPWFDIVPELNVSPRRDLTLDIAQSPLRIIL